MAAEKLDLEMEGMEVAMNNLQNPQNNPFNPEPDTRFEVEFIDDESEENEENGHSQVTDHEGPGESESLDDGRRPESARHQVEPNEEEPGQSELEGEGEEDPDPEAKTRSFQNRLEREKRLMAQKAEREKAQVENYYKGLVQEQQRNAAVENVKARITERRAGALTLLNTDALIEAKQGQLQAAYDDENQFQVDQIRDEIRNLQDTKRAVEGELQKIEPEEALMRRLSDLQSAAKKAPEPAPSQQQQQRPQNQAPRQEGPVAQNTQAAKFQELNSWIGDPQHAAANQLLTTEARILFDEGKNPESPEYFEALANRIADRFPQLGVVHLSGAKVGARGKQERTVKKRSPVAPSYEEAGARVVGNKVQVSITPEDKQFYKQFPSLAKMGDRETKQIGLERAQRVQRSQRFER